MGYIPDSHEWGDICRNSQVINPCCWEDLNTSMDQDFIVYSADMGPNSKKNPTKPRKMVLLSTL